MPSSYTDNLGIQKPANGEQSGVWGDTVNTNMDIVDRAINGVLSLSLSGISSTLTTTDGVTSNGQYKLLVLGGSPSGTHTITISPNDGQKIYFVYNNSGQSVVFTQGSGGNITISNGTSKIIYADGAGSAAKVASITDLLSMSNPTISGGSISSLSSALGVASGGTGATTITGLIKGNGTSAFTAATAGSDYQVPITGAATTIATSDLTASRAVISNSSGKVDVSTTTSTEIGYVSGVTSAIQTQINSKQASDATLTALAAYNTNGFLTQTAADTFTGRSIAAGNGITVSNGDGVSGNPSVAITTTGSALGQVLTSTGDGLAPSWVSPASGYQVFTASGTWTKPTGLSADTVVTVEAWGAGGGGARKSTNNGGGGGGGAYAIARFRLGDLASTVAVGIGLGGTGGTTNGSNGVAGGNTTFGSLLTAYGGGGGGGTGASVDQMGGGGGGSLGAGLTATVAPNGGRLGGGSGAASALGGDATTPFGGGAGGGGGGSGGTGGWAYAGGGGGATATSGATGGTSMIGGAGGAGAASGTAGGAGSAPAGGGAAGNSANGGAGARGEVRIWI